MKERKGYECEKCSREVSIRSTNKNPDSDFYRKKLCPGCNQIESPKKDTPSYSIPKQTEKNKQKKKEKKEVLDVFFSYHISQIQTHHSKCAECSIPLMGIRDEVCHILPKRKYASVMSNLSNAVYRCSRFGNNCHAKWDANENNVEKLAEFKSAKPTLFKYFNFRDFVLENGSERDTLEKLSELIL